MTVLIGCRLGPTCDPMLCPNWGPTSGLGPPWLVSVFGVAHGMYAAGFLGAVTRGAAEYGLQFSNYFEPVNEGAFNVFARNITVTPVGQVRQPRHHFGTSSHFSRNISQHQLQPTPYCPCARAFVLPMLIGS